jgi:hypothetical protein
MVSTKKRRDVKEVRRLRVPAKIMAESTLLNGKKILVATAPGRYYLGMTLFDVHEPPISQSLARITITK